MSVLLFCEKSCLIFVSFIRHYVAASANKTLSCQALKFFGLFPVVINFDFLDILFPKTTMLTWSPHTQLSLRYSTSITLSDDDQESTIYSHLELEPGVKIVDINLKVFHYKNGLLMVSVKSKVGDVWIPFRWIMR